MKNTILNEVINKKYSNRLEVLCLDKIRNNKENKRSIKEKFYICHCICGNTRSIKGKNLLKNKVKSCGCLRLERITKHEMSKTKIYSVWSNIIQKCNNIKATEYKNYGGRGVGYDPRWNEFLEFKKDMYQSYVFAKKKYRKELKRKNNPITIERINNDGNYCKENCCWIPMSEQHRNRRTKHTNKWFEAISPEGKKYKSNNQSRFAQQHNLLREGITTCLTGKRYKCGTYKGWVFNYTNMPLNDSEE